MKMIFLVDGDNNIGTGLKGIDMLSEQDTVLVFYQKGLALTKIKKVCAASRADVQYVESVKGGKNSIDFQIITELGVLVGKREADFAYVISQDKGYAASIEALRLRYADAFQEVALRPSIEECLHLSFVLKAIDRRELAAAFIREYGAAQGQLLFNRLKEIFTAPEELPKLPQPAKAASAQPAKPQAAPAQPAKPQAAPAQPAKPQAAPAQPAKPQAAPAQPAKPQAAPAQPAKPQAAPAQPAKPQAAPAQPDKPQAAPAQPDKPNQRRRRSITHRGGKQSKPTAQPDKAAATPQTSLVGNATLVDAPAVKKAPLNFLNPAPAAGGEAATQNVKTTRTHRGGRRKKPAEKPTAAE